MVVNDGDGDDGSGGGGDDGSGCGDDDGDDDGSSGGHDDGGCVDDDGGDDDSDDRCGGDRDDGDDGSGGGDDHGDDDGGSGGGDDDGGGSGDGDDGSGGGDGGDDGRVLVLMIVIWLLVGITRLRQYKLASVGKTAPFSLVGKKQSHSFFFSLVGQPVASSLTRHSLLTLVFPAKEAIGITVTTSPLPAFPPYNWATDISKEPLVYSKQELTPLFFWVTLGDVNIL